MHQTPSWHLDAVRPHRRLLGTGKSLSFVRRGARGKAEASVGVVDSRQGAGFGAIEENKRVEQAAIRRVTRHYKDLGWEVCNVSKDNRGYDLLCEKGAVKRHVEVKGSSGRAEKFIITAHEAGVWESDSHYVLAIVRCALSKKSSVEEFIGLAGRRAFSFQPIAYWAKQNGIAARRRRR